MSYSPLAKSQAAAIHRPGRNQALRPAALILGGLLASAAVQAQNYTPLGSSSSTFGPTYFAFNAGTADLSRPITAFGVFGGEQQGQAYGVALGN